MLNVDIRYGVSVLVIYAIFFLIVCRLAYIPKLVDIIATIPTDYKSRLLPYVKAKPIRTASGVAVVAVMSKPHRCPHIAMTGNVCVY